MVLPPIGLLFLFLMDTLGHEGGASGTGFQDIIDHILNLDSSRYEKVFYNGNSMYRISIAAKLLVQSAFLHPSPPPLPYNQIKY